MDDDASGTEGTQGFAPDRRVGVLLLATFGVAVVIALVVSWAVQAGGEQDIDPDYTGAIESCRSEIGPRLKDPSTAEFSDETYAENDDGVRWRIRGTVRSTNSFGAVVPSAYECVATWQGETFTAEVTSLG